MIGWNAEYDDLSTKEVKEGVFEDGRSSKEKRRASRGFSEIWR